MGWERARCGGADLWVSKGWIGSIGTATKPGWLTTETVLNLAGKTGNSAERYRQHCEEAIGQGAAESPWDELVGQAVLGGERFVARLVRNLKKSDPGRRRLQRRPGWGEVVRVVEKIRGEKWAQFRDRYGDVGRDLALYLGRTVCGLSIVELSKSVEIKYVSAATAVRRFSEKIQTVRAIAGMLQRATHQLNNE